jgi:hypothetical protein
MIMDPAPTAASEAAAKKNNVRRLPLLSNVASLPPMPRRLDYFSPAAEAPPRS